MNNISLADLSITLVEPSPTQYRIISKHLQEAGVTKMHWHQDAQSAEQGIRATMPDLVISAMYLPDKTGTELVQTMRADKSIENILFMLISSETSYEYIEPIRQAGAIAILPKPFDPIDLNRALNTTLDFVIGDSTNEEIFFDDFKVLIVDDSSSSRKFIKRVLTNLNIVDITEVETGKQAIEQIENNYFDLLVTDYNMPEMDGRELTMYIRELSIQPSIPILMVTSELDSGRLTAIKQSGISAICDKPFEPTVVKALIKQITD